MAPSRGPYDSKSGADLDPRTLGERIKKFRWHFGWTQEDLSRAVNTDQAIISNWERDKARPSGAALAALAQVFRTSPLALDTGEGFVLERPLSPAEEAPIQVSLPSDSKSPILIMDLRSGLQEGTEFQEALALLLKGTQEGRRVWMIFQ
ncbi:MAG: helix-turn-helix transcriptional regulator [Acidobacteria bacterium]|nr:helix-turn-helix transcriptional regulator [Acidobacteriota bacterium]